VKGGGGEQGNLEARRKTRKGVQEFGGGGRVCNSGGLSEKEENERKRGKRNVFQGLGGGKRRGFDKKVRGQKGSGEGNCSFVVTRVLSAPGKKKKH